MKQHFRIADCIKYIKGEKSSSAFLLNEYKIVFLPLDSVLNLDSFSIAEVENLGINTDFIESFQVHISNITRIPILSLPTKYY